MKMPQVFNATTLSTEARFFSNLINKHDLDTVDFEQMQTILWRTEGRPPHTAYHTANALRNYGHVATNEQGIMKRQAPYRSEKDIAALWYVIYAINKSLGMEQRLQSYIFFPTDNLANLGFVLDQKAYQVCVCDDVKDGVINALQKNYEDKKSLEKRGDNEGAADSITTIFVFRNSSSIESTIAKMERYNLTLPHQIAFMGPKHEAGDLIHVGEGRDRAMQYDPAYYPFKVVKVKTNSTPTAK